MARKGYELADGRYVETITGATCAFVTRFHVDGRGYQNGHNSQRISRSDAARLLRENIVTRRCADR